MLAKGIWERYCRNVLKYSTDVKDIQLVPSQITRAYGPWLPRVLAASTWVSLNPYFFWHSTRHLLVAAFVDCFVFGLAVIAGGRRPGKLDFVGVAAISAFVFYITALPNLNGSHTRWVFVLPTLWTMAIFDDDARRQSVIAFASIIAVTLIPGILVGLWRATGLPIEIHHIPYYQPQMAASNVRYATAFGALFVDSNSITLPWGGVLARMSAIYDEPGQVGTMAGLILMADRFRMNTWRNLVLTAGGIMS